MVGTLPPLLRRLGEEGPSSLPRPLVSLPPPSPHFLKAALGLSSLAASPSTRGGFRSSLAAETPVSGKRSHQVPFTLNYLTIKTPYKNVKLFFWHSVCTGKKRGTEYLIGSSKGEKKRLRSLG